jgi:hypothetical protein
VASPKEYTSYASLSLKQKKKTITRETRKFTSQPESGGSSCQLSIMAQKYPKAQEEKF